MDRSFFDHVSGTFCEGVTRTLTVTHSGDFDV